MICHKATRVRLNRIVALCFQKRSSHEKKVLEVTDPAVRRDLYALDDGLHGREQGSIGNGYRISVCSRFNRTDEFCARSQTIK